MQYKFVAGLVSAIFAAVPICGQVHSNFQTPLTFEENRGQTASAVEFMARGPGYTIFLTSEGAVFQFGEQNGVRPSPVRLTFPGSDSNSQLEGHDRQQRVSHYFVGRDESRWQRHVPHYARVVYSQIYPGIDVVFYGAGDRRLEFDFVVAPGASPDVIRLGLEGVDLAEINGGGDLVIRTGNGEPIVVHRPHSYQEISGEPQAVASRFVEKGSSYGIQLDPYNSAEPLIIDPVLSYSTYLGGTGFDTALGIDVDAYGEAAVTGWTDFPDFPPSDPPRGSDVSPGVAGRLVFVTKFQSDGTDIVFTTFIGGEADDRGLAIALHHYGTIFVSGDTESIGFPTTAGAFQTSKGIGQGPEAFVFSLSRDGSEVRFSTYLGGDGGDEAWAIDVDDDENVYVAGSTLSNDFPTTAGVVQPNCAPNATMTACASGYDAFVTRLKPDGKSLGYSTYLGGSTNTDGIVANADDRAYGIAVNPTTGWATVTGWTGSLDFPTNNAAQNAHGGDASDAFVTKLDFGGTVLIYSTYLGGSGAENFGGLGSDGGGVAVALDGTAYVTGKTGSTDFPAAGIPLPDTCVNNCGLNDAFVTRFSSAGAITYSSYLGGTSQDTGVGIDIDALGRVYVTGETTSNSFPLENELYSFRNGTDGFVTLIDFSEPAPVYVYSTFFGGPGFSTTDQPRGIVADGGGAAFFAGDTASTNLPTTMGAYDEVYSGGGRDAFVTRILDAVKCVDGTDPVNDWDGDGIFTCWEEDGIDFDDDGTVDLPLHQPPFNANPDRKDIFLEIDYMVAGGHTHQPTAGALQDVVQAFAKAPVLNPVGGPGITLHLMLDEAINPEVPALLFETEGPSANDDFNDFKLGNPRNACGIGPTDGRFGTSGDRMSANCANILGAKRLVFRYALFAHGIAGGGFVGFAELPGNDLILALGTPSAAFLRVVGGLRSFEAATFMHEFGHTLGLGHGGGDHRNCKPNYLSIMNYSLADRDLDPTRPLDFSRSELPPLDENNLSEPLGVQGAGGRSVVYGVMGATTIGQDVGPIDWNGNGSAVDVGLVADINWVQVWCRPEMPALSLLKGHDDWTHLTYSFRSSPDFADRSIRQTVLPEPERTPDQIIAAAMSVDFDGDGLSNFDDNCPAIPNPGQDDDDGDLLGDACDGCPFDSDLDCLFSDGFESGDTVVWSAMQP